MWESSFNNLKQALTSSPILSFPREEGKFILDTDALNFDAILSQKQNEKEKVISYFSRVLPVGRKLRNLASGTIRGF